MPAVNVSSPYLIYPLHLTSEFYSTQTLSAMRLSQPIFAIREEIERHVSVRDAGDAASKHETLARRWFAVGPTSQTLGQQQTNLGPTSHVCWGGGGMKYMSPSETWLTSSYRSTRAKIRSY